MIAKIRSWTRNLYAQAQHWGRSEHCIRDLAILTIIGSTIIPIPIEALLIAIITAAPRRWLRAAVAATAATVLGALIWYLAGRLLGKEVFALMHFISPARDWHQIKWLVRREGMAYLTVAAFTPGLFRVVMVTAGVVGFNPLLFILSVTAGRGFRFILEAGLLRLFGEKLGPFLEKYFDLLALGIGATAFILLIMIKLVNG